MDGFISRERIKNGEFSEQYNNNEDILGMLTDEDYCSWKTNAELVVVLLNERCNILNFIIEIDKAINKNEKSDFYIEAMSLYDVDITDPEQVLEKRSELQKMSDDLKKFADFINKY